MRCGQAADDQVAPLLLARHAIPVAVHLGSRAVLQEVRRLRARRHLRTVLPAVAPEPRRGFDGAAARRGALHRDTLDALLTIPIDAERRRRHDERERHESALEAEAATRGLPAAGTVQVRRHRRHAHDANRLRPPILTPPELVGQDFTDGRPRPVARKRADVDEHLGATVSRGDESEATLVVPGAKGAGECQFERPFGWSGADGSQAERGITRGSGQCAWPRPGSRTRCPRSRTA